MVHCDILSVSSKLLQAKTALHVAEMFILHSAFDPSKVSSYLLIIFVSLSCPLIEISELGLGQFPSDFFLHGSTVQL